MNEVLVTDTGGVRRVRIDRPAKRNALTRDMYGRLADALAGASEAKARVVWLCGTEECFTAGNDMADFGRREPDRPSSAVPFLAALSGCKVPIVASVNGPAVGIGTTMLLHCDLVYASAGARFQLAFVNLGLCPEAGSTILLPARAGSLRAAELLLLGEPFDAAAAHQAGLVNAVLATPTEADQVAREKAQALAAKPPDALRTTRALLRGWQHQAVQEAMRAEGDEFARLLRGPEAREAVAAFLEKRRPDFQHRAEAE